MIRVEEIWGEHQLVFENGNQSIAVMMKKEIAEHWKQQFDKLIEKGVPFQKIYEEAVNIFGIL